MAGLRHSLVLTASNEVFSFGDGEQGQLGFLGGGVGAVAPPPSKQLAPRNVVGLPPDLPILFLAAGGDHSMAVLRAAGPGERVALGPSSERRHGRGAAAMQPLPAFTQLCAACAPALLLPLTTLPAPTVGGVRADDASASAASPSLLQPSAKAVASSLGAPSLSLSAGTAALVTAIEDLFSSPGELFTRAETSAATGPPSLALP